MIFLIDNDAQTRDRLSASLRWFGYEVEAFAFPRELPPLVLLRPPQALLIRCELPEEQDLAFVDRFHDAHPTVPVFLLTTQWSQDLPLQMARRSFLWICQETAGHEEFGALIASVCGRKDICLPLSA